jgi:acylphosphatase
VPPAPLGWRPARAPRRCRCRACRATPPAHSRVLRPRRGAVAAEDITSEAEARARLRAARDEVRRVRNGVGEEPGGESWWGAAEEQEQIEASARAAWQQAGRALEDPRARDEIFEAAWQAGRRAVSDGATWAQTLGDADGREEAVQAAVAGARGVATSASATMGDPRAQAAAVELGRAAWEAGRAAAEASGDLIRDAADARGAARGPARRGRGGRQRSGARWTIWDEERRGEGRGGAREAEAEGYVEGDEAVSAEEWYAKFNAGSTSAGNADAWREAYAEYLTPPAPDADARRGDRAAEARGVDGASVVDDVALKAEAMARGGVAWVNALFQDAQAVRPRAADRGTYGVRDGGYGGREYGGRDYGGGGREYGGYGGREYGGRDYGGGGREYGDGGRDYRGYGGREYGGRDYRGYGGREYGGGYGGGPGRSGSRETGGSGWERPRAAAASDGRAGWGGAQRGAPAGPGEGQWRGRERGWETQTREFEFEVVDASTGGGLGTERVEREGGAGAGTGASGWSFDQEELPLLGRDAAPASGAMEAWPGAGEVFAFRFRVFGAIDTAPYAAAVEYKAATLGLTGAVEFPSRGEKGDWQVEGEAEGGEEACEALIEWLCAVGAPGSRTDGAIILDRVRRPSRAAEAFVVRRAGEKAEL